MYRSAPLALLQMKTPVNCKLFVTVTAVILSWRHKQINMSIKLTSFLSSKLECRNANPGPLGRQWLWQWSAAAPIRITLRLPAPQMQMQGLIAAGFFKRIEERTIVYLKLVNKVKLWRDCKWQWKLQLRFFRIFRVGFQWIRNCLQSSNCEHICRATGVPSLAGHCGSSAPDPFSQCHIDHFAHAFHLMLCNRLAHNPHWTVPQLFPGIVCLDPKPWGTDASFNHRSSIRQRPTNFAQSTHMEMVGHHDESKQMHNR